MQVDFAALLSLEQKGDLEGFLAAWDYALMVMHKPLEEELHLTILEKQLRRCPRLAQYFRFLDVSPYYWSFRRSQFLYDSARQVVVRRGREQNKDVAGVCGGGGGRTHRLGKHALWRRRSRATRS